MHVSMDPIDIEEGEQTHFTQNYFFSCSGLHVY